MAESEAARNPCRWERLPALLGSRARFGREHHQQRVLPRTPGLAPAPSAWAQRCLAAPQPGIASYLAIWDGSGHGTPSPAPTRKHIGIWENSHPWGVSCLNLNLRNRSKRTLSCILVEFGEIRLGMNSSHISYSADISILVFKLTSPSPAHKSQGCLCLRRFQYP